MKNRIFRDNDSWFAITCADEESILSTCFYHFMYALFLPLLNCFRQNLFRDDQGVYVLTQGQFDRYIHEIVAAGIGNIKIMDSVECIFAKQRATGRISYFVLDSLEFYFRKYGRFSVRPATLNSDILTSIGLYGAKRLTGFKGGLPLDILIVDRQAGISNHGADLRCIPNMDEIFQRVKGMGYRAEKVFLENTSMAYQISVFRSAKIVIAQHGAALSHLIWMRPGRSGLIEIVPKSLCKEGWEYYDLLATAMDIDRVEIVQDHKFSAVNPSEVLSGIQRLKNLIK